jgi:hypothetical protein
MKGLFVCSLLLVLTFAHYANATYGVDVSQSVSKANFQCLIGKGHRFAIVRVCTFVQTISCACFSKSILYRLHATR